MELFPNSTSGSGSVSFEDADGTAISDGDTVEGGTEVTLTATPDSGYYAVVTVGGDSVSLDDNGQYTWSFDDDTEVVVTFKEIIARSDITESVAYDYSDTTTEAYILPSGLYAAGTYYFDLTEGATLNSGSYISFTKAGSETGNSIVFSTGDLTGKTATLEAEFVTASSSAETGRYLGLNGTALSCSDGSDGSSQGTTTNYTTVTAALEGNTDYYLASTSGGIRVRKVAITVEEAAEETASTSLSLNFKEGKLVTDTENSATYYFVKGDDGTYTSYTEEPDDYDVSVTNVKYHGTIYGLSQSSGVIILKDVVAPVKITLGATNYGGQFTPEATIDGTFTDADGNEVEYVNGYVNSSIQTENVYYFDGTGTTTITLTGAGGLNEDSPKTLYISTIAVETVVEEEPVEQTYTNSATYDLRSDIGSASDDGCFTTTAVHHENDNQHGYIFSANDTFTVYVMPNTTIKIGNCNYSSSSSTFTVAGVNEDGEAVSGISSTSFTNYITEDCDTTTSYDKYSTVNYTGTEKAAITFTASASVYVPYVVVEEYVEGNESVVIKVDGMDVGDILLLYDASSSSKFYTYKVAVTEDGDGNKVADLSGTKLDLTTYTLTANGYTLSVESITIQSGVNEYTATATADATEEISSSTPSADIYVGYVKDGTHTVYNTVQTAVNNASAGDVIQLAGKKFTEKVLVETDNITINGTSADSTIITFNDSETKTDAYFHGATLSVIADDFVMNNVQVMNTSEDDDTAYDSEQQVKNGTAFSVGYVDNISASATLNNCIIFATRDTICTGKTSSRPTTTYNSCTIYGFQDVICGGGNVVLNDCTWDVNSGNNARFFAPQTGTTSVANNLTIVNSGSSSAQKSTFARAWGQSSDNNNFNCVIVINGYTDSSNNIIPNGTPISSNSENPSVYGFETKFVGSSTGDIKNMFWLVRATEDSGYYNTTYSAINAATANEVQSVAYDEESSAYKVVGVMDSDFEDISDITKIGFNVYNGDDGSYIGNVCSDTVYLADDDSLYYTIVFMDNSDSGLTNVIVKPYIYYITYDVEGDVSQSITLSAE